MEASADEVMGEHFHPQAALVDGKLVGATAMISFEITVPGERTVAMGGVTGTSVIATHRRRGLLRRMMQAMFDEALERGEPLAGLSASAGSAIGRRHAEVGNELHGAGKLICLLAEPSQRLSACCRPQCPA